MTDLLGKNIILTGAGGTIGQCIARRLVEKGAKLACFEKTKQDAEATIAVLPADKAKSFAANLLYENEVKEAVAAALDWLGTIDGLVNNAVTLLADDSDIATTPLDSWNETLAVNLTGTFLMCQNIIPHLQTGGAIVNMSSVVAHSGSATAQIAYTTSKGGIEAMTREIAISHARAGIRANAIAPGPIYTERTAHYFDTPEKWQLRRRHIPLGRLGKADEIAALVGFLLSDDAGFTTGATYLADGGISAAYIIRDENGQETP